MLIRIHFISGYRANATHIYKNKNQFKLAFWSRRDEPLRLTDFKAIEVISQKFPEPITIKCTFNNGQEALAKVTSPMLEVLQVYLFEKSQTPDSSQIATLPQRREDLLLLMATVIVGLSLFWGLFIMIFLH